MRFDKFRFTASLCAILGMGAPAAHAAVVFSENFDAGSATFTANNPYWTDPAQDNGLVLQNTAVSPFTSSLIPQDASGSGYFLFEGTSLNNPNPSASQFYISPSFAVAANTDYTVSFDLTNGNALAPASVQPEIGGVLLGSPVSAVGTYDNGDEWQTFSFTWNSGSATTASLALNDFTSVGDGNDFGVDDILVQSASAAIPEPASLLLLTTGLAGLLWSQRRRGTGRVAV